MRLPVSAAFHVGDERVRVRFQVHAALSLVLLHGVNSPTSLEAMTKRGSPNSFLQVRCRLLRV